MKKKTPKFKANMQEECDNTVHKFQTDTQPVGFTKELRKTQLLFEIVKNTVVLKFLINGGYVI